MRGNRKEKKERDTSCQVCFYNIFDEHTFERLVCNTCGKNVHRNCYNPASDFKNNRFRCDECKYLARHKDAKLRCSVCNSDNNGILKDVSNDEWMHVLCALSSARARLTSYKQLIFLASDQHTRKATKNRCANCTSDKNPGLPCTIANCSNFSHLTCILSKDKSVQDEEGYSSFLTIGLLNKHNNSLLNHILSQKQLKSHFNGLQLLRRQKMEIRYFVCQLHNSEQNFNWCICSNEKIKDDLKECEKCSRWFHKECEDFNDVCSGCLRNDIFVKNARLPQLIERAIQVEECPQLDKAHIKYMDHFCLKPSQELFKIIIKHQFDIERYYLRKTLQQFQQQQLVGVNKLEILYYLSKRKIKRQEDITPNEISQIINLIFGKSNKFEVKDKSQPIERKSKGFLEQKLRALQRDGTQQVKMKLTQLVRKNQESYRTDMQIASDIFDVVKSLEASEGWKQAYTEFPSLQAEKHLIQMFYELKFSAEEITSILSAIRLILNAKKRGFILESQFLTINPILRKQSNESKNKLFTQVFTNFMRGLGLRKIYKQKQKLKNDLETKFRVCKNWKQRQDIQYGILSNKLIITQNCPLIKIQQNQMEVYVLKKLITKKYSNPTPEQLHQTIIYIKKLLEINNFRQCLEKEERVSFQKLQHRFIFYQNIHNNSEWEDNDEMDVQISEEEADSLLNEMSDEKSSLIKRSLRGKSSLLIKECIENSLTKWDFGDEELVNVGVQELYNLAVHNVSFEQRQAEIINKFAQNILSALNNQMKYSIPTAKIVSKLTKIAKYALIQDNFPHIVQLHHQYCQWKEEIEIRLADINLVLQSPKLCNQLLRVVDCKIQTSQQLEELDIKMQVHKLRTIKMWILLSQKLHPQHKATITAIHNTKSLMDKMHYPSNSLKARVDLLQAESRSLNKRIGHFLEKPKMGDLQIYDELKLMNGKMTLKEGIELRGDLEGSQLDVEVELQELNEEIKQFHQFPKNLKKIVVQAKDIDQLSSMRAKIFQNSLRYQSIEDYHCLLLRIIELKCTSYKPGTPITKKEYFRFISLGGEAGSKLYNSTINLFKAYKQVEKAERQLLSTKPKFENLLAHDCRKIKEDLKDDSVECAKVMRWLGISDKIKQKFKSLRSHKPQCNQLLMMEMQLMRLPLNNKPIIEEIGKIRREVDELTMKVKAYINDGTDSTLVYQNPYTEEIINKYRSLGAKNQFLERFDAIYQKNKNIMELGRNISPENYTNFSQLCGDIAELTRNDEVYRMRGDAFNKMVSLYLQSPEPMMELGYTLLGEGGALLKFINKSSEVIMKIIEINQKFNKWSSHQPLIEHISPEQNKSEQAEARQYEESEEDMELMEDVDDSQMQDSESEESGSGANNRKRPYPAVVELDDD